MAHNADLDQQPLRGVVLCCTALAQDVRTNLAEVASQMGAVHKLDLTADVTHLVVGNINTPKYKYVAKERPDIRVLSPDWIPAVRDAWTEGGEVDVESLEKQYTLPTFFGLQLCLTGVEDMAQRKEMESTIIANGGIYNGDLTKQVTHLVVARPAGQKYIYAKQWGINVVSLKWYADCLTRGLSLDENCYLPEMPLEEQGVGAFRTVPRRNSLGKRGPDDEQAGANDGPGRKRLRKSYSMKMSQHSQDIWHNLGGHEVQVDNTLVDAWEDESQTMRAATTKLPTPETDTTPSADDRSMEPPQGLLGDCVILVHGFDSEKSARLRRFLEPNGATVVASAQDLQQVSLNHSHRSPCLVIPHDYAGTLPSVPDDTIIVTQWWVERCIHYKKLLNPDEDLLSSPLLDAAVTGFQGRNISTTGFDSVDLRQTAAAVKLMGATYQELLSPSTSILICASQTVKKEKAFYASKHQIPIVTPAWLWQSLRDRKEAPIDRFLLNLPAVNRSEKSESSSAGSGRNVPPFRRSGEAPKRLDELNPKRLSNTRVRQATSALPLKASRTPPPEPSKCPFVLEDDEEESLVVPIPSEPPVLEPPASSSLSAPIPVRPLREISPNTSPSKDKSGPRSPGPERDQSAAPGSPKRSPGKENQHTELTKKDFAMELASLIHRNTETDSNAPPPEERKRKNRPLGRNLSVISNRSGSASGSPAIPPEVPEHISPADGFPSREHVSLPPSTQLGYETPEIEAHRREMSKKMGFTLEETGTRVPSIGTVKDTREVASRSAAASRSKTRTRHKT